jgi:hypothetical protein
MAEHEFPKWSPFARDRRLSPADIRSGEGYRSRSADPEVSDSPAMSEVAKKSRRSAEMSTEATQHLGRLQQQPTPAPLDEIATLVQSLTYGEMMELSQAIWKGQPHQGSDVTQESLPALLYCWSISRSAMANDASEEMLS